MIRSAYRSRSESAEPGPSSSRELTADPVRPYDRAKNETGLGAQTRDCGRGQADLPGRQRARGERGDGPDRTGIGDLIPGRLSPVLGTAGIAWEPPLWAP